MAADQLQQLRDIHLPESPGWWPPAPGWWLLAVLVLAAAVWAVWRLRARHLRRRPLRWARTAAADIYGRYRAGTIGERDYFDEINDLLKRVLIHALGEHEARRPSGDDWLRLLDRHLGEPAFSAGPGRALGEARFRPQQPGDPAAVQPLIERLLVRVTVPAPPRRGTVAGLAAALGGRP